MTDMVFGAVDTRHDEAILSRWWRTVDRWTIGFVLLLFVIGVLLGLAASPPLAERNGLGAIKAVSAASLAMRGDGKHLVSLDVAIETMRQTGVDMSEKYKETALGGLAVNVPNC